MTRSEQARDPDNSKLNGEAKSTGAVRPRSAHDGDGFRVSPQDWTTQCHATRIMSSPLIANYAVAVPVGDQLRLVLRINRNARGEVFVIYPTRARRRHLHSSYHADGTFHYKSYGQRSVHGRRRALGPSYSDKADIVEASAIRSFGRQTVIFHWASPGITAKSQGFGAG